MYAASLGLFAKDSSEFLLYTVVPARYPLLSTASNDLVLGLGVQV